MPTAPPSSWPLLMSAALLSIACSRPAPQKPEPPPTIEVQPRRLPCQEPGPRPPSLRQAGFVHENGRQCLTEERFEAWWAWQTAQFAWSDAAETCIEALRAEGLVRP